MSYNLTAKGKLIAFKDFLGSKKSVSTQDKIDLEDLIDAAVFKK